MKKFIQILILMLHVFAQSPSQGASPKKEGVAAVFPELCKPDNPKWKLLFDNGKRQIFKLDFSGKLDLAFKTTFPSNFVGYHSRLRKYLCFDRTHGVIHHADPSGNIVRSIYAPVLKKAYAKFVLAPSGQFALVATLSKERVIQRRNETSYDYFLLFDVWKVNTKTGRAFRILKGTCRELGAIHPAGNRFLFTNEEGSISICDFKKRITPTNVNGSRPYWNSNGDGIRFVKAQHWIRKNGKWIKCKLTGSTYYEYEFDLQTKKEDKLGQAGRAFIWSPNRKLGARIFCYDTLIPFQIGVGSVVLESADSKNKYRLIKDIQCPIHLFWMREVAF